MSYKGQISYLDFDMYSKRISFYYKHKERLGSTFGFILTVSYTIISIILFILYFIDAIVRSKVDASNSIIYPNEILSIDLNNDLFYLAFGLENPIKLKRYIDETIYYPEVLYIEKIKRNGELIEISRKKLNIERCNIEKLGNKYKQLFDNEDLDNSYCLDSFNLTLMGSNRYEKMSYITINIYPCVNNSENSNHCKPQNIIDTYLTSAYFSILAKDIGLNPFNYSTPTVPIIQELSTSIDKSIKKEYFIFFGITKIDTDIGLFSNIYIRMKYI